MAVKAEEESWKSEAEAELKTKSEAKMGSETKLEAETEVATDTIIESHNDGCTQEQTQS